MIATLFAEIIQFLHQGGFVMWPLVIATFVLWYALGYRFSVLRRGNRRSVRVMLERYRDKYDREPRGVVEAAVLRGLGIFHRQERFRRRFLDDAFSEYNDEIERFAILVRSIVILAPLLGLLGTVSGMIEMFDALPESAFYAQSGGIAGGISKALFTTQMGLAVAVPGMVVGRILEKRQTMIARELDQVKDILTQWNR